MKEKTEKLKTTVRKMFSLKEDNATNEEIKDRLLSGGKITGTNMCVLICAMIIASVGLITSSTAVIIGAMLISPIMGSILAATLHLRLFDCERTMKNAFWAQAICSYLMRISFSSRQQLF